MNQKYLRISQTLSLLFVCIVGISSLMLFLGFLFTPKTDTTKSKVSYYVPHNYIKNHKVERIVC